MSIFDIQKVLCKQDHHFRTAILAVPNLPQRIDSDRPIDHQFLQLSMSSMSHSWVRTTALFFWVRKGYPAAIAMCAMCRPKKSPSELCSCEDDPLDDQLLGIHAHNLADGVTWRDYGLWNRLKPSLGVLSLYFLFLISNGTNYLMLWSSCVASKHDFHRHHWLHSSNLACIHFQPLPAQGLSPQCQPWAY